MCLNLVVTERSCSPEPAEETVRLMIERLPCLFFQRIQVALEILLWVAVCSCEDKKPHIEILLQMEDEFAAELKCVVQEQQQKAVATRADEDDEGGAEEVETEEQCSTVKEGATSAATTELGAGGHTQGGSHNSALEEQVKSLLQQLETSKIREQEMCVQLQEARKASLDEEMRAIEAQQLAERLESDQSSESNKQRQIIQDLTNQLEQKVSPAAALG